MAEPASKPAECAGLASRSYPGPGARVGSECPTRGAHPSFTRILAATDFSSASAKAVQVAARLAAQCGASLTLMHVVDVNPRASASHVGDAATLMGELRRRGAAEMARLLRDLMEDELSADAIITEGLPWEEVQKYSNGFDLLVLGKAPARRRWSMFSSQTTKRTLRTATCPVLIV